MTADVELLPVSMELKLSDMFDAIKDYARANVAHATAAKDAEIEALRAENASLRHHGTLLSNIAYNLAQDGRLPDGMRWSLDDARKRWDSALNPTAAQENDDWGHVDPMARGDLQLTKSRQLVVDQLS